MRAHYFWLLFVFGSGIAWIGINALLRFNRPKSGATSPTKRDAH